MHLYTRILWILLVLCAGLPVSAQRFFNLAFDEVRVDTVLPRFTYSVPLYGSYQDSVYTATIHYPEFVAMTPLDIEGYRRLSGAALPALPDVAQRITVERKRGVLELSFCPLVFRDGRYQKLVSFMLRIDGRQASAKVRRRSAATRAAVGASRYSDRSVLASGRWAKIRVPASGVYQLAGEVLRRAGFRDPDKVKIYGYGGNLQNEQLVGAELQELDDLKEVPTCVVGGKRLFYAKGPVSWSGNMAMRRTRNPYSDYGYYFITQGEDAPLTVDSTTFLASFYPSPDDYHTLYEVDGYSWYQGGRNLFDSDPIPLGKSKRVVLGNRSKAVSGKISVCVSAGTASQVEILYNGRTKGTLNIRPGSYDKGSEVSQTYTIISDFHLTDTVQVKTVSGGPVRLDYVAAAWDKPAPPPRLTGTFAAPEFVQNIDNQDLHGHGPADMVIIIPASRKLLAQAARLADFHMSRGLRVRIVPADQIYNEFSSGTPDANAYRRYLKMLYDRAGTEADMPRYLLLFGDCVWDNRMLTPECRSLDANDYLLCFESENSFNEVNCYVDDGFFCLLDDGEGNNPQASDKLDMCVGRFPVTTEEEARVMVDKTIAYVRNDNAGAWQNVLMFMGDDGNNNLHMRDVDASADEVEQRYPGYLVKKVMWDAYKGESSSTGHAYPEVTRVIKRQQEAGALIMDYAGHGREDQLSHENVLRLSDFATFKNKNLPLWITASCDIMPFDGVKATIGEAAVLNPHGGAVAFFGTTRTVYANYNKLINMAFLRYVLSSPDGKPMSLGEAQRQAKNLMISTGQDLTNNKLQYSLLGDPSISLNLPAMKVVIDSINGVDVGDGSRNATLRAGEVARVVGHVEHGEGFDGVLSAVVRDSRQLVTGRLNASAEAETPFRFYDRPQTLYQGTDSIRNGKFAFSFAVPVEVDYTGGKGLMNLYAVNSAHTLMAHGAAGQYVTEGYGGTAADGRGPKIYAYLNTPDFADGGHVNVTPYFVAQLRDSDGINVTGNGIGHDLQLVIDDDPSKTYTLNENFRYDFGSYTSGVVAFSIPVLEPGRHRLRFRAWDVRNNPSVVTLDFTVVKGLTPTLSDIGVSRNPASTFTTFIVNHDMAGSNLDVTIDVFDMGGRLLWTHSETGVSAPGAYTFDWDLTRSDGGKLQTGVYIYRVRVSSDGSGEATKAKKLVVISNN